MWNASRINGPHFVLEVDWSNEAPLPWLPGPQVIPVFSGNGCLLPPLWFCYATLWDADLCRFERYRVKWAKLCWIVTSLSHKFQSIMYRIRLVPFVLWRYLSSFYNLRYYTRDWGVDTTEVKKHHPEKKPRTACISSMILSYGIRPLCLSKHFASTQYLWLRACLLFILHIVHFYLKCSILYCDTLHLVKNKARPFWHNRLLCNSCVRHLYRVTSQNGNTLLDLGCYAILPRQ